MFLKLAELILQDSEPHSRRHLKLTSKALKDYCEKHEKEIKKIIEKAVSAKKARTAAKKARENARKPKSGGLKAKMALSKKFIDCKTKDPKKRVMLLVEGQLT